MLKFMDMNNFIKGLEPVTNPDIFNRPNQFSDDSLYSERIFGSIDSPERRKTYSYIELYTKVLHPTALRIVLQLNRKLESFLSASETFSFDKDFNLIPDPDGFTGMTKFIEIFPQINFRGETETREKYIKLLKRSYDENVLFIDKIPVIPPDFRPAYLDQETGNWIIDAINDIYQSIIRKSIQVKSSGTSGVLFDLLSYGSQLAVVEHDKYVKSKVEKKNGLIRSQMLGKRVDFSGRAVITPGPDLKVNEVGVPFRIAVGLFEPFLIHRLLYSNQINLDELNNEINKYLKTEASVDSVRKIIKAIKNGDKIPKKLYDIFWNATEIVMKGRVVICKRDPVLHPESLRGFYPVLVPGDTLQICTLVTSGFNADFDGDMMAIYSPLSDESQQEIKDRMMNLESSETSKSLTFALGKEMFVGLYTLTKNISLNKSPVYVTQDDLDKATNPYIPVVYKNHNTTMGKAIFNNLLPNDYPFVDDVVDKKIINKILNNLVEKYDKDLVIDIVSKIGKIGFKFATLIAPNISLDDIEIPDEIYELKNKLLTADTETAADILKQMQDKLAEHLKGSGLYDLIISGAGKGFTQINQILCAKGIVTDTTGNILEPVKTSFAEGLSTTEFFKVSPGARKGLADRIINTADTGYFSRKLAFILNPVEADLYLKDCGTTRTIQLKLTNDLIDRLHGRYIVKNGNVEKLDISTVKPNDIINLRTPMYCLSSKICHTCYGDLLRRHKSPYIGILASQIIGEKSTQAIMRCSDGLIQYSDQMYTMIDFFDMIPYNNYTNENGIETKYFDDYIKGKDCFVGATSIQKHLPTDKVLFISTDSGHALICQANHPLIIKDQYNKEIKEIFAYDLKLNDLIWIDNIDIITNNKNIIPEINGHDCGIYCFKENINENYNIILGNNIYNKRLNSNFINYSEEWLEDFISGCIDINKKNSIFYKIITQSYYLAQQIKMICLKLKYNCKIYLLDNENKIQFGLILTKNDRNVIKGFDKISNIKEIDWDYPLYDIKTETNEFMLSCVQNHNSFHTGGVIEVKKKDMLKDIIANTLL